jgi:WD40 repeat protein
LASGSHDRTVQVWDAETSRLIRFLPPLSSVMALALTGNGQMAVATEVGVRCFSLA